MNAPLILNPRTYRPRLPLALVLLALSLPDAVAQISVSGSAEIKVAPDEIRLSVGVETRDENLGTAKGQNDERMTKALAFIKGSGARDQDVQTDFMSVDPVYDGPTPRTKPTSFLVRKSIEIRWVQVKTLDAFIAGLLTNGVTTIHGIEFRTTQLRKHRDAARALAIRAATEKADALAAELGVRRGKVQTVSANDWSGGVGRSGGFWGGRTGGMYQNTVQNAGGGGAEVTDGTLAIGQISVAASVNVSFLIN